MTAEERREEAQQMKLVAEHWPGWSDGANWVVVDKDLEPREENSWGMIASGFKTEADALDYIAGYGSREHLIETERLRLLTYNLVSELLRRARVGLSPIEAPAPAGVGGLVRAGGTRWRRAISSAALASSGLRRSRFDGPTGLMHTAF